jgi:proline iminopeptidase
VLFIASTNKIDRDEYIAPIPEPERKDMVLAYHAQLNCVDETTRLKAAKAWSKWELVLCCQWKSPHQNGCCRRLSTSRLYTDPQMIEKASSDDWANAFARIENHYFVNEGFMRQGQLLEKQEIDKMSVLYHV